MCNCYGSMSSAICNDEPFVVCLPAKQLGVFTTFCVYEQQFRVYQQLVSFASFSNVCVCIICVCVLYVQLFCVDEHFVVCLLAQQLCLRAIFLCL